MSTLESARMPSLRDKQIAQELTNAELVEKIKEIETVKVEKKKTKKTR